jgi:hypothetical protein
LVVSRFKQICDDEAHYQGDVATVIPLYRSPTLTDAEREAISEAIAAFDEFAGDEVYVAAMRGLLDRLSPIKTCDSDRPQPVESTPEPVATPGDGSVPTEGT